MAHHGWKFINHLHNPANYKHTAVGFIGIVSTVVNSVTSFCWPKTSSICTALSNGCTGWNYTQNNYIRFCKTRNEWQSLAYSLLSAVVSTPSEYLWKTLTYWSPECLTAPPHSEHWWTKRGNNYRLRLYKFFCLKLRGH